MFVESELTDPSTIAAAYSFDRFETNLVITAANRLGINVWQLADKVYGWSILNHWDRSDWSVENIVAAYREATVAYH